MLNFSLCGEGDQFLAFLHGISGSSIWWADTIRSLQADFRIAALDSLGHGLSPRLTDEDTKDVFGASYQAALTTLKPLIAKFGPALLVAHSMGGAIASYIAWKHPELVRGLVLAEPAWLDDEQRQLFLDSVPDSRVRTQEWAENIEGAIHENQAKRPHWTQNQHITWAYGQENIDPRMIAGVVSFAEPWQDVVGGLTVPTTVVTSDGADCLLGPSRAAEIRELGNPNVKVAFFEGGSHATVPDNPAFFETQVRNMADTLK
ncbi:alpha/beta fold hydrolase [Neoactinobaculum massilliense]|uniref:alpha/beta fold hydrolase n=1 Tax=Neoactinobaculum massilliense TaxID=2364794 RepID=UPI0013DDF607|nr:alpha/beta hydrolase [Neoactinobaculum massilliense]